MRPDKREHAYDLVLKAAADAIRKQANGRMCGQCDYFDVDRCDRPDLEWTLNIVRVDAVACSKFKGK